MLHVPITVKCMLFLIDSSISKPGVYVQEYKSTNTRL